MERCGERADDQRSEKRSGDHSRERVVVVRIQVLSVDENVVDGLRLQRADNDTTEEAFFTERRKTATNGHITINCGSQAGLTFTKVYAL